MRPRTPSWLSFALFAVVAAPAGCERGWSGAEARDRVARGARLVDVRTPAEFAARHIEGAVNVPVDDLAGRLEELQPKDRPIVLYCRSGNRSARAARMLRQAGFSDVHDLGSIDRW